MDSEVNLTIEDRRTDSVRWTLLLAATTFYGLAVSLGVIVNVVVVVLATAALVTHLVWNPGDRPTVGADVTDDDRLLELRFVAAVVLFGLLGLLGHPGSIIGPSSFLLERAPGLVWILLVILTFSSRRSSHKRAAILVTALTIGVSLLFGIAHLVAAQGYGFDVLLLHTQAADAMANGENPYTDVVSVPNGAPTARPGDTIDGYVYPPVTAIAYSLGEWTLDDPRYVSLASWIAVLWIMGVSAIRRPRSQRIYVLLLLASLPGWPLVLRAAWTEPLSLAFLALAALFWHRPATSGTGLGIALASKQYFVVTAPLLLLHRDIGWRKRVLLAVVIVVATVGAALLIDPAAYWSATVEFHASTPARPDSSNLVGLLATFGIAWEPPFWLPVSMGFAIAVLLGRRSRTNASFASVMAVSLAVSFFVSSQAFANYWFLVMGLSAVSLVNTCPTNQVETPHSAIAPG